LYLAPFLLESCSLRRNRRVGHQEGPPRACLEHRWRVGLEWGLEWAREWTGEMDRGPTEWETIALIGWN